MASSAGDQTDAFTAHEIKQLGDEDVIGFHARSRPFRPRGWAGGALAC
jgi:hypothetical protein